MHDMGTTWAEYLTGSYSITEILRFWTTIFGILYETVVIMSPECI